MNDMTLIQRKLKGGAIIYPVADVHYGAIEHCEGQWATFCERLRGEPNSYIMLGGDLINNSIRTSVANPFDETCRPRDQKRRMVEYLEPIKDKILCVVSGNHEARTIKDTDMDITYDIMAKLDLEDLYRENVAFVKVSCDQCAYVFVVTHGTGGGIYTGAMVNRNERFGGVIDGLDCLIVGHSHKGSVTKPQKIVIDKINNTVSMKTYTVIAAVSWQRYGGYAARKMLQPADACNPQQIVLSGGHHDHKKITVTW